MAKLQLHFQRFEFKYVISPELENAIRARMKPYVQADPYATDLPGGAYEVASLYFDSPGFYYYHQKIDGVQQRKKIRLRAYRRGGAYSENIFFEIKRKHDAVVLKDRCVLTRGDYHRLIEQNNFDNTSAMADRNKKNIVAEFEWERQTRVIAPKIAVIYEREPYLGKYNQNFRVTFDRRIRAMQNDNLLYSGNEWLDVLPENTVMELKFNGALPFYMAELIREFNLERVPYSKYCAAIETCGSLSRFRSPIPAGINQLILT